MKTTLATLSFILFLVASCSNNEKGNKSSGSEVTTLVEENNQQNSEVIELSLPEKGMSLIQSSDCYSCHKLDAKLLGPSWQDIANRYNSDDTDMLANKIIDGSTGVWGELQMTPHPGISLDDAKTMVTYILTTK